MDLPDIATSVDNIQIQRGVGTSTNGAAAFGASINFQTQKLKKEPYAVYDGTFGSFQTLRNAISAGTGLIKDHFNVDLRFSDLHSDGYMDRSWTNLQSYYVSAGYHDAKTLVKFITFSGTEELYQAWNGVPSDLLESNRTYNELGAYTDAKMEILHTMIIRWITIGRITTSCIFPGNSMKSGMPMPPFIIPEEQATMSNIRRMNRFRTTWLEDVIIGGRYHW